VNPPDEIANWEIFVWSLSRLGRAGEFVDVEDAFIDCFELAPKRFAWRTRNDLPDYKKCSKALRDAEARRPQLLVKTRNGLKRQLTVEGQEWVRANERRMVVAVHSGKVVQEPRSRPRVRMLDTAERSDAYQRWIADGILPEKWQVGELLRCLPDSDFRIWHERLEVMRAAANGADRVRLLEFLNELATANPDWFKEETP
jgi:hypothetical protein